MELREVRDDDWRSILRLAQAAVAHVPDAGSQRQWLINRRRFELSGGHQVQYVCEGAGRIKGYGAVESDARGRFRIFIVAAPSDLDQVGPLLHRRGMVELRSLRAQQVWFTEYAEDAP